LASFNGITDNKLNAMLVLLLSGKMQCWVSTNEEGDKIEGIVLTKFSDDFTGKILVVLSLYALKASTLKTWSTGLETLKEFARTTGCYSMVAQVNDDRYVKLLEKLGAKADIKIVTFKL